VTIKSHQTYINLTDEFFKQRLLSIFKQCCEKGTREETWAAALLVDRHSGRSTIETIHEVRLKQFSARFADGLRKPVNPRGVQTSRRNPPRQRLSSFPPTRGTQDAHRRLSPWQKRNPIRLLMPGLVICGVVGRRR
jgi:hypothetical protein